MRLDAIGLLGHDCGVVGCCWKILSVEWYVVSNERMGSLERLTVYLKRSEDDDVGKKNGGVWQARPN